MELNITKDEYDFLVKLIIMDIQEVYLKHFCIEDKKILDPLLYNHHSIIRKLNEARGGD